MESRKQPPKPVIRFECTGKHDRHVTLTHPSLPAVRLDCAEPDRFHIGRSYDLTVTAEALKLAHHPNR